MLWVYIMLLGSPTVWLLFMFIVVASLLPSYAIRSFDEAFGIRLNGLCPTGSHASEKQRARKMFSYRRRRRDDIESTDL